MWIVPAQVAGTWQWNAGERSFETEFVQSFQNVDAMVPEGEPVKIDRVVLNGPNLSFDGSFERDGASVPLSFDGEADAPRADARGSPCRAILPDRTGAPPPPGRGGEGVSVSQVRRARR